LAEAHVGYFYIILTPVIVPVAVMSTKYNLTGADHPIFYTHSLYYSPAPSLFPNLSDSLLALLAPILAYWLTSLIFYLFDISGWAWLDRYRIHDSAEVATRNRATPSQVFRAVLLQQLFQTALGYIWLSDSPERVDHVAATRNIARVLSSSSYFAPFAPLIPQLAYLLYWWFIPAAKLLVAM
jgi:sphinganine C4-monooxygenase